MSVYAAELLSYFALGVAFVVVLAFYVSWRTTRLDRLHGRVEAARAALDAALVRRVAVAQELAGSTLLDPAASLVLASAAHDARAAEPGQREIKESDLSRAIRAVCEQPGFRATVSAHEGAEELLGELDAATTKVLLARRFYNNAVGETRTMRGRWFVRTLRLAGRVAMPDFFEIDDVPPASPGKPVDVI